MKAKIISFLKNNINPILLGFYLGTILNIQLFTLLPSDLSVTTIIKISLILIVLAIYLLSCLFSIFIIKYVSKIKIKIKHNVNINHKKHYKTLLIFFITSLAVSLIWFIAYSPGNFSADSINQYEQALINNYSDWHPVLHTLLFFKLPMLLFNNNASAIIICQIILFCIVISYSLTTIYEIAGKKYSIISAIIMLANPIVMDGLLYPWKDIAFGIFALFILTATLKIYASAGTWGNKNSRIIILAIAISCATIFRHNAILFTLPLIISLFFFLKHSQWIKLFALTFTIIFLIKIPLYSVLQVSPPGNRTSETAGLSLAIIGSTIKTTPNSLDEELTTFAHDIASQEDWNNKYVVGDFNSIKWQSNLSTVEDAGLLKTAQLAAKAIVQSPAAGLNGLFKTTQVVYNLEKTDITYDIDPLIVNNKYNINYSGNSSIRAILDLYRKFFDNSFLHYFTLIGTTILIMIIFILSKNHWKNKGWQKILLCSSILFYDFGTMLFLTSPETRFFYVNFLIYPIIIILSTAAVRSQHKKKMH